MGDPTSHGGKVLEGSLMDICHGKPIAYVGHKTSCPKCKGTYAIIEGALTTTFYGKGVALAGMKTACGATLIATQFTDVVEYGHGPAGAAPPQSSVAAAVAAEANKVAARTDVGKFDLFFLVKNGKGTVLADMPYKITLEDGSVVHGTTDHSGHTQKVFANTPQKATIEVPYYDHCDTHSPSRSDTCGC
jgi:uncharacterized Zn-binding protein involved in type VI secretion